jgi:hypothetical protein
MSIADIALQAHYFKLSLPADLRSGLDARYTYDHPYTTLPNADRTDMGVFYPIMGHMCHIPIVEVDPETGQIKFLKYVAVHDAGTVVNPMTLAGHIRGGTVQGIGSVLYEHYYYGASGQLLTATYADYLIPTVAEAPENTEVGHVVTPSPYTEHGIKGGGEGGRMGAPARGGLRRRGCPEAARHRGHLPPAQIATSQDERSDTAGAKSRELRPAVSDPRVLGDDRPSSPADLGQPLLVARALGEVGIVGVDFGPGRPEGRRDQDLAERTVDEEGRGSRARRLRAGARSGALPGCQGRSARSPWRVPPPTPQP